MEQKSKKYILNLAKQAIKHFLFTGEILKIDESELIDKSLAADGACFVTLTIFGQLRGCIGHTEAIQPLYLDVIENSIAAAFDDPRFPPLTEEELEKIDIEVSVLSPAMVLSFSSPEDLLSKIRPNVDGVILQKGDYAATYLPQVWEQIKSKEEFLSSLCIKAGLSPDEWQTKDITVLTYQVEIIR